MKAKARVTTMERKLREQSRPALVKKVMQLTMALRFAHRAYNETNKTLGRREWFERLVGLAESIPDIDITVAPHDLGRAVIIDGKDRLVFNREDNVENDRDFHLMDDVYEWLNQKADQQEKAAKVGGAMPAKLERDIVRAMVHGGRTDIPVPGEPKL